jgi:hypothetical protein
MHAAFVPPSIGRRGYTDQPPGWVNKKGKPNARQKEAIQKEKDKKKG